MKNEKQKTKNKTKNKKKSSVKHHCQVASPGGRSLSTENVFFSLVKDRPEKYLRARDGQSDWESKSKRERKSAT